MDGVLRAAGIYLFVLLLLRISGPRSMGQMSAFDFVLLMIVSEATQQAMISDDFSVTMGWIVISTLVVIDIVFSVLKQRSTWFENVVEGTPIVLVQHGEPLRDRMNKVRVDEMDVLAAARMNQGLERMDQIKYAVLERTGAISIIPASAGARQ